MLYNVLVVMKLQIKFYYCIHKLKVVDSFIYIHTKLSQIVNIITLLLLNYMYNHNE